MDAVRGAEQFGQTLARLRQAQRLSQNQLAGRAGLNHSYISRLESGIRDAPSPDVIEKFVAALGLDLTGRDADDLRVSAGYLPADSAHLLAGNGDLADLARLLDDPRLPEPSRSTLRRLLALLVEEYARIVARDPADETK